MKIDLNINNFTYKKRNYKAKRQNNNNQTFNSYSNNSYPSNYYSNNFIAFKGKNTLQEDYNNSSTKLQEEKLTQMLVEPTLENSDYIPSAILLYSENDKKTTALIDKISKEMNARVIELDTQKDDFSKNTYNLLKNSRENYIQNNQKTLIVVKNSDLYLSDSRASYKNVATMKNWLYNCAKNPYDTMQNQYATTFLLTTDNPKDISSVILDHDGFGGVVCIQGNSIEDIKNLVNSYIETEEIEPLSKDELDDIAQNLSINKETGGFSDDKIKSIINKAITEEKNGSEKSFSQILNEKIATAKRDISPRAAAKILESRKWLVENGWIEVPKFKNIDESFLNKIEADCSKNAVNRLKDNKLTKVYHDNSNFIQNAAGYDVESLKDATIGGKKLIDFWLEISDDNISNKDNQRLKNMWFDEILSDEDKTNELISKTLDILEKENKSIEMAREAYFDIIENDETITFEQKEILIQQQESKMFFDVVIYGINPDSIIQIEDNVLSTLDLLSWEKERIRENANENIFKQAKDITILSGEDSNDTIAVNYIFQLVSNAAVNGDLEEKENIKSVLKSFNLAKETGNLEQLAIDWKKLVNISENYFNTTALDDITDKNIELLNSINNKKENITDKSVQKLLDNPALTIEQKEFTVRYANNTNFKTMIKNPNIDIEKIIENLVFFEADNKNLIQKANLDISGNEFSKMMDDKFKQIHREAKDINIQGNKIASKLDSINSSIKEQNGIINEFIDNFSQYAQNSLAIQGYQLEQLVNANGLLSSINTNTKEINTYTKTLVRAQLIELEKDKYYKDIVPELVSLLPADEQIDVKDFLLEVDKLAKKEKNALRKKKIIKAAAVVLGTVTAGVALYYFGPDVVAHLLSQTNPQAAAALMANGATASSLARKLGSANAPDISFKSNENNENIKEALDKISPIGRFNDIIREIEKNPNGSYNIAKITEKMSPADAVKFKSFAEKLQILGVNIK